MAKIEKFGKIVGYILMFVIFSIIFHFILIKTRFPDLVYIGTVLITLSIVLTGTLIKFLLK